MTKEEYFEFHKSMTDRMEKIIEWLAKMLS
jgi:hypothetical protein